MPANRPILDLGGRIVLPGFVGPRAAPNDFSGDMNAQNENNENTEPIVPEMNARFAIEPWYPSFPAIREIGITSQNIAPAQLNLIGGSGVFIRHAGMDVAQMVRRDPASMVFSVTRESAREWGKDSRIPVTPEAAAKMIAGALAALLEALHGLLHRRERDGQVAAGGADVGVAGPVPDHMQRRTRFQRPRAALAPQIVEA